MKGKLKPNQVFRVTTPAALDQPSVKSLERNIVRSGKVRSIIICRMVETANTVSIDVAAL